MIYVYICLCVCYTSGKSFKPRHQGHLIVFSKESEISAGHQSPHFLVLLSSGHWFRHQDSHWLRKHWGQSSSISSVAVTIFGKCQSLLWIRVPNFVSKLWVRQENPLSLSNCIRKSSLPVVVWTIFSASEAKRSQYTLRTTGSSHLSASLPDNDIVFILWHLSQQHIKK